MGRSLRRRLVHQLHIAQTIRVFRLRCDDIGVREGLGHGDSGIVGAYCSDIRLPAGHHKRRVGVVTSFGAGEHHLTPVVTNQLLPYSGVVVTDQRPRLSQIVH